MSATVIGSKSDLSRRSNTTPGPRQRSSGISSMVAAGVPPQVAPSCQGASMGVVACTPILVIVSSAQPSKSLGKSRNGRPAARMRQRDSQRGLGRTVVRMKGGSVRR
jgi:hypothetical protein